MNSFCNWHVIFVETGEEEKVKLRLTYKMGNRYSFAVPKRRLRERKFGQWKEVLRPLFPGYVFMQGTIPHEEYVRFRHIPGILRTIRSGQEMACVCEHEMEFIGKITDGGDMIGYSDIFVAGEEVQIVSGPLINLAACIQHIDKRKGRAKVKMHFLGQERVIDLGINVLTHIS